MAGARAIMASLAAAACALAIAPAAHAEPNPKRKMAVLEYRSCSSALTRPRSESGKVMPNVYSIHERFSLMLVG